VDLVENPGHLEVRFETNGVHVVNSAASRPPDLFRYFLSVCQLPHLWRGANSTNLAHMLGNPYLSLPSYEDH